MSTCCSCSVHGSVGWLWSNMSKATLKTRTAEKKAAGKKARSASSKKLVAAMKKAKKGIFAPKKLSDALAAICGAKTLARTEVTLPIARRLESMFSMHDYYKL